MSRLGLLVARFHRPLKVVLYVAIAGVIVGAIGTVGFIEYSAQPGFCLNCHIMEPYYDSWASSSHNQVPCIKCHYAPGIRAEAMGKLQAANQVVKYVTGTYGLKPWAEIEDAACLRSGCHVETRLEAEVVYRGVRFDHAKHLGELRRGKQLRCTSCHSQIVQGEHVTVTEGTCYLCHFKGQPAAQPIAGCVGCHPAPPRVTSPDGFVVDHPQYVRDLVSCLSCHEEVTHGSGAAEQSRCFNCHNEPGRLGQFADTDLLHRVHISERNVECQQCHTPIEHHVVAHAETFELDCRACHQGAHEAQRLLYAGRGGHATENLPSTMYLASVSCESCHDISKTVAGHERVQVAGEAACLSCHGIRYANILPQWRAEMERKVASVDRVVRGAERAAGAAPVRARLRVDSLLGLARANVELVRVGRGAHNVAYADRLLRAAVDLVRDAVGAGRLPYAIPPVDLGPAVSETQCLQCHLGMERRTVPFAGRTFAHERHVLDGALRCATCHTPLEQHGGTRIRSVADCAACHHPAAEPRDCAACHDGPGGTPEGTIATAVGDFPHDAHRAAGLQCAVCHRAPAMTVDAAACAGCHAAHHRPAVRCLSCHRAGTQAKHMRETAHTVACSSCHGEKAAWLTRWSRQVCTTCHVDRTEHFAPNPCEACHNVPPMGGGERR